VTKSHGMRLLVSLIVVGVMVGGCASQASHYNADTVNSNAACEGRQFKTLVERVRCLDSTGRPVVFKDLPNLLAAYDIWNSARLSATNDYDNQVRSAKAKAWAVVVSKNGASTKMGNQAMTGIWPQTQTERDSIKQEADKASSQCKKDGVWKSQSMLVNYKCDQDARLPVFERRIPAGTSAFHIFWNEELAIGSEYDQAVSRAVQAANIQFNTAIGPAKGTFISQVQLALQNDAAVTARQQQQAADNAATVLMLLGAGLSGYNQGQSSHSPISTSCTTTKGITNPSYS
jgi:hypothetical protein